MSESTARRTFAAGAVGVFEFGGEVTRIYVYRIEHAAAEAEAGRMPPFEALARIRELAKLMREQAS